MSESGQTKKEVGKYSDKLGNDSNSAICMKIGCLDYKNNAKFIALKHGYSKIVAIDSTKKL